ncbi:MAG: response regulator [Prevotella sp.]|nr:response regulator [Prevotella sp.]
MKHLTTFLLTILILCHCTAFGQDFRFYKLGTHDGLSNNSVNIMHIDNRGLLWTGTAHGLNRYDGYSIKTYYNYNNDREKAAININNIQEDALGNLWIEGSIPLARYDYRTNHFDTDNTEYLNNLGFSLSKEFKLCTDADGSIWLISKDSIEYKNIGSNAPVRRWRSEIDIEDIRTLHADIHDGEVYMTDGTSVWHFSSRSQKARRISIPDIFTADKGHLRIYIDTDGLMWIYSMVSEHICYMPSLGTSNATMFYLPDNTTQSSTLNASESNAIRKVFDDGQENLWIATDHRGLFLFNKSNGHFENLRHNDGDISSVASDNITCITADRQGTIWLGHQNSGISYCNMRYNLFRHRNDFHSDISTMLFDRNGDLWLGTDGNGLYIEHKDGTIEKTEVPNITISSLLEDRKGTMWVGTYNAGLLRMNGKKIEKSYTAENGTLPHNSVWQMCEDGFGNIWYTSVFEPVARFDISKGSGEVFSSNNHTYSGTSIAKDNHGKIYCGTYYGIMVYDPATRESEIIYGNNKGTQKLLQQYIGPLHFDRKRHMLWIGHMTGISIFDQKTDSIYYLDSSTGLIDTNIKAITNDANGNIWVSTSRGMSCIQTTHQGNNDISFHVRNYTDSEGIQIEFFNAYAATHDSNGEVYMGGKNGYTHVISSHALTQSEKLQTFFTDICIGDSVAVLEEGASWGETPLRLKHNDLQVVINFFTGNLISAHRVIYSYRLKGLHDEWINTSDNNVSFYSLPAGRYVFEVKACGEDGEWGDTSELEIIVSPPFYLSWPMITLYITLAILLAYLLWMRAKRRQQQHIAEQQARIEQQQMVQMSDMKLRFFTNISHDLRTPLTLIISPLQTLLEEPLNDDIKKRLKMMHKNVQLLYNQVNMLLDFRRLDIGAESLHTQSIEIVHYLAEICHSFADYAADRKMTFQYHPDVEKLYVVIDAEKINKIMYNILSNAFKFTPDNGTICVLLEHDDDNIKIIVSDSGQGIADEDKERIFQRFYQADNESHSAGSGIGLHIVKEYVKLHGGSVTITDNSPCGSVFTVSLPKNCIGTPEDTNNTTDDNADATDNDSTASSESKTNSRFTILVADDSRDLCTFIADSLSTEYNVLTAADGEEALQMLRKNTVNLVVSDIMMPKIDGLELCKKIKTDIKWSHIPVILLTAKSADMSIVEGLQQGADDYITKPFNIEHLRLRVQKFIDWTATSHRTFRQKIEVAPSEITITPLDEKFVEQAIAIVEKHIADTEYSVEQLGHDLGMSRTNLYKKLVTITGKGPHDFIRTIRLKRAYQLLEKSQMNISEIAYHVGYSSPKRFSENFKNEYGMTPSEFVKNIKKD